MYTQRKVIEQLKMDLGALVALADMIAETGGEIAPEHADTIRELADMIGELEKENEKHTAKAWEYIKEKRRKNPDYARPEKEHRKKRGATCTK